MIQAALATRSGPSANHLAEAPFLDQYRFAISFRDQLVLQGHAVEHPVMGEADITTSALILIDPERRIARTASRWYRLGQPEQDPRRERREPELPVVQAYLDAQMRLLISFADRTFPATLGHHE